MSTRTRKRLFHWSGYDQTGQLRMGILAADNKKIVMRMLYQDHILTKKIVSIHPYHTRRFRVQHSMFFFKQLHVLLQANLSCAQALELIAQATSLRYQGLILSILQAIEQGIPLSQALRQSSLCDRLSCDLIQLGEVSCSLPTVLSTIVTHHEQTQSFKQHISQMVAYPLFILSTTFLLFGLLVTKVIPQFETIYQQFGAQLPPFTQNLLRVSHHIKHFGLAILGVIMLCISLTRYLYKKNHSVGRHIEWVLLKLPLLGPCRQKIILTRFAQSFYIALHSGLPMLTVLDCAARACGSRLYLHVTADIKNQLVNGISLSQAMKRSGLFTSWMRHMIHIGEETATLETMIQHIIKVYSNEVHAIFMLCKRLLEPIIMSVLGILIGGIVIALYLPMITMSGIV